jgi:hypothetical protein
MALQSRRQTLARYGVSSKTIERWEDDPALGFPAPVMIRGRKFDDPALLDRFDRECIARGRQTRAGKSREVAAINSEI